MPEQANAEYLTEVFASLEQAFWDERGRGGRYRTTLVGVNRFKDRLAVPKGDWRKGLDEAGALLKADGVISDATPSYDGQNVIKCKVTGCAHAGDHTALKREPFVCPPANILMHAVSLACGVYPELMQVKCQNKECNLSMVVTGVELS
ncbi:MAG: hypothetical protein HPY55_03560 [Firmicutes bacterium]|nr:hypothetical protein [Bacillota bacterium]